MERTPLLIIKTDPEIDALHKQLQEHDQAFKEKLTFIKKQHENATTVLNEKSTEIWKNIEAILIAKGHLEDAEDIKLHIENGVVFKAEGDSDSEGSNIHSFLSRLFGGNDD